MKDFKDVTYLLDLGFLETIIILKTTLTTKITTRVNSFENKINYYVVYTSKYNLSSSYKNVAPTKPVLAGMSRAGSQIFVNAF